MSRRPKILLVEDEPVLQSAYAMILGSQDYDVHIVGNGLEALNHLDSASAPDLILLDMLMPKMNGLEFMKLANKKRLLKTSKVIMLSNFSSTDEVQMVGSLGVSKRVLKADITPLQLIELVEEALQRKSARHAAEN